MIEFNEHSLHSAQQKHLERWTKPIPSFTSGQDSRTSDNAMLVLIYGNLQHASKHEWQNAGRSLIDKTYLSMLQHVQQLTNIRIYNPEVMARELDSFIKDEVCPNWTSLQSMDESGKQELSISLIESASQRVLSTLKSELVASRILTYLCPQLPIFNLSQGGLMALQAMGYSLENPHYAEYHQAMTQAYLKAKASLNNLHPPQPTYGSSADIGLIKDLLLNTDWWQRRLFETNLLESITDDNNYYACNETGKLQTSNL